MHSHCLNCYHETKGKFCQNCGQKTDTHRIVLGHFLTHDLMHGVWHLEKGILFTIKEIFVRPGQAALDYIKGKRIRYYNVFYLSLLLIGLNILLSHFFNSIHPQTEETTKDSKAILLFLEKNVKIILLCVVPVIALNAMLVFRRLKLNFAEHLILGGFNLAGMLIINVWLIFFSFLNTYDTPAILGIMEAVSFFACLLFPVWVYFNATKGLYKFGGFVWRFLLFYLLLWIEIIAVLVYLTLLLTGKTDLYINI
jgi:Protein of unknown function (DUF3667)